MNTDRTGTIVDVKRVVAWHHSEPDNPASFEANILQRIKHHSPSGMSVGYGGSGAADFALNILDYRLRILQYRGKQTNAWNKAAVFTEIFGLHHSFKWTFLAIAPDESFIEWSIVDAWMYATRFDSPLGIFLKTKISSAFRESLTALYDEQVSDELNQVSDETARRTILCFRAMRQLIADGSFAMLSERSFEHDASAFIKRLDNWRAQR